VQMQKEAESTTSAMQVVATQAALQQVNINTPNSESTAPIAPTIEVPPTPLGIYNPSGIVQSDLPIYVDGFSLRFREFSAEYGVIKVRLTIQNMSGRSRVFRFIVGSVTLRDDVGNVYPTVCDDELYNAKQFTFDNGKSVETGLSVTSIGGSPCYHPFPAFLGTMSPQAKSFFIGFKDFGSFTDFEIEVKP